MEYNQTYNNMRFCDVCENRLDDITTSTELYYQCTKCKKKYESTAEDSCRFVQAFNKRGSMIKHDTMLRNAAYDNVNPRVFRNCKSCKREIMSYVVVGDSMRHIYLCVCGYSE